MSIRGIFVPHASVEYSGYTAGQAYNKIDFKKYKKVIMFSTNHYYQSNKLITINKYNDPIINNYTFVETVSNSIFNKEHSWKNQLSFVKHPKLSIYLVGDIDYKSFAQYLFDFINPKILLIFNSDLSHEQPTGTNTGKSIKKQEQPYINSIVNLKKLPTGDNTICGIYVIQLMIQLLRKFYLVGRQVSYSQSGNIKENIKPPKLIGKLTEYNVSYLSVIYTSWSDKRMEKLYKKYENEIVKYSEDILKNDFSKRKIPKKLKDRKVYCFVTITNKKNKVLGCMRNTEYLPLNSAIMVAINSIKKNDSRYDPHVPYSQMKVKVSILGEPEKLSSVDDIQLGKHGITLMADNEDYSDEDYGVYYLADVPIEQRWTKQQTIDSLKEKGNIGNNSFDIYKVPEINLSKKKSVKKIKSKRK